MICQGTPPPNDARCYTEKNVYSVDNIWMTKAYDRILRDEIKGRSVLELGLGYGYCIERICKYAKDVTVLEGSEAVISNFLAASPEIASQINIVQTLFEDYATDKKYDCVTMGFVLEHVEDPGLLLRKFREMLAPKGTLIAAVPNAESLHRQIGHRMGLLDDLENLSPADLEYGHRRYYRMSTLKEELRNSGYRIVKEKGLVLKLLTTSQLSKVAAETDGDIFFQALIDIGYGYPALCNGIAVVAEKI